MLTTGTNIRPIAAGVARRSPAPPAAPSRPAPVVILANRLPGSFVDDGSWVRSPGGLVTALFPAIEGRSATWIGATTNELRGLENAREGVHLVALRIATDTYRRYCDDFSNAVLWPLYHDALRAPRYDEAAWFAYVEVNRRFAECAAAEAPGGSLVWVHDYHLQLVPALLRQLRPDVRIGYFHHVPFPQSDLFSQLPWRREVLQGLLGADLIGFQRERDLANFSDACASILDLPVIARRRSAVSINVPPRRVDAAVFPVPVDAAAFGVRAGLEATVDRARAVRKACGITGRLLLGVDRLDYTKGIDQRLRVLRTLFESGALDPARDAYLQIAVPSRDDIAEYACLRSDVERLVGDINGSFAALGRPVVHYLHRSVDMDELAALYRAADVMLVTPFRDGMNLVAKEYVASRSDGAGHLVLSEFAGAADELPEATMVNPHDARALAEAIGAAAGAVSDGDRPNAAMAAMRRRIEGQSPCGWSAAFLGRLAGVAG